MATNKLITSVQVIGLGIGLGSVILMLMFILHEYSFDKYHKNSGKVYRVVYEKDCSTPYIMGESFKSGIPEIKNVFRIYSVSNTLIKCNEELIKEDNFLLADSSIFSVLDIPIIAGNPRLLFQNTNDVVISDKAAQKYFGNNDPVGKPLEVTMSGQPVLCNVSGIFKRFPSNSSFQSEIIGNIQLAGYCLPNQTMLFTTGAKSNPDEVINGWKQRGFQTFVLIPGNISSALLENKATVLCKTEDGDNKGKKISLQPFTRMYFHSGELWNYEPLRISNLRTIRIFEGIALLILLTAWFNYILLSTAETRSQLRELACRKVIGASSGQIALKTYVHSLVITLLSLFVALLFVQLIIPLFNQFFDKNIDIRLLFNPAYLGAILLITLITGLSGGSYVSFYMARLKPVNLFKPLTGSQNNGRLIPSGVIIMLQFSVFILLSISAIIVEKQVWYSENKSQGFNSNHVVIFKLNNQELKSKIDVIRSKLESNPHVIKVATSAFTPPTTGFIRLALGNDNNSEPIKEEGLFVGNNLIELLQIPVQDGHSFYYNTGDKSNAIIINESASKKYKVKAGDQLGSFRVCGIVKDFHVHSFHKPITPLIILKMNDNGCYELAVRSDGNDKEVINTAHKIWKEILPTAFFDYQLLNDRIVSFYDKERNQAKTITFFSFLAIFLCLIGLFGYVSVNLIKRTKEIGIRKVNGARVSEVLLMLNTTFIKWVAVAFIIACPIAYYAMHQWLQNFAYKTELSWWVFVLAGLTAVAVAILTVSWQSWRAATRNPVESLRYE
ncbi:MAG TPA: FtsX-like permease family protein [Bacteroidales bacterium]